MVSIITPCYNGEAFAGRFFENILEQTYSPIELIFINDGSTDKTGEIVEAYREKLEKKGIRFVYLEQENAGQAVAVSKGLSIFNGEYLMWTDSDDLLDPDNVERKVQYLEEHPEDDFVMCRGRIVKEGALTEKIGELKRVKPRGEDDMFRDLLEEKNIVFTPGVYMVRRDAFLRVNPKREIIPSRAGQNWQILLPLAYSCKYGYMREELFSYVIREDSHSRQTKSLEAVYEKLKLHNDLLRQILIEMGLQQSKYWNLLEAKYLRKQFDNAYFYHNEELLLQKYEELKACGGATKRDMLIKWAGKNRLMNMAYTLYKKLKTFFRSLL